MKRARSIVVVPALALAAVGLTACQQPTPGVTAFSGTTSSHRQAACWAPAGAYLTEETCTVDQLRPPEDREIPLLAGRTVGISVDPAIADIGWFPTLGGDRLTEAPVTTTYWRFAPTAAQAATPAGLSVIAANADGTRGVWTFRAVPAR